VPLDGGGCLVQQVMPPEAEEAAPTAPARDPAPSRWSYRLQRWMLTPGIRLGLRIGVPAAIVFGLTSSFLAHEDRRDALRLFVSDIRTSIEERPEFMVNLMAVDGAGPEVSEDIREVVPVDFPISSFNLDLAHLRDIVVGLDPVKEATVRIRPGGILQVNIVERKPAVIWRSYDGLALLDETGAHVSEVLSRRMRADLPLIAGDDADQMVREALTLYAAAAHLDGRLRGLLRIGGRRWDVILDRGQRIMLPPDNPVRALERVIALHQAQDLLERDVKVVDMRLGERPTVRMSERAVKDWWRIRQLNGSGQ